MFERIRAHGVVAVRTAHADGKSGGLQGTRDDLQANPDFDVFCWERLIDRQRKPILLCVGADVLDGQSVDGRRVAHHRPLSQIALAGPLKVEIGWWRSNAGA